MTFVGNPALKPTFVDYYELIYIHKFKKATIRLNPFYQVNRNTIYQSLAQDPLDPNRLLLSYSNDKINYIYSLEIGLYYKITNWWSLSVGSYITNFNQKGIVNNQVKEVKNTIINTSLYQSFTLTKKWKATLFGKFSSASKTLQFTKSPTYKIDIATRYQVLKNKGSLSLRFTDIFNTSNYTFFTDAPFNQKGLMELDAQSVYLGFSYDFGSSKIKNRRRKKHKKQVLDGGGIF
jgi:outer membrane receptor protein involved in Fe transport